MLDLLPNIGQVGLDQSLFRSLLVGGFQDVDLSLTGGDTWGLLVIPDEKLHDLGVDDGRLPADHFGAVVLDTVCFEAVPRVALLGLDSKLLGAAVAVDVQTVEDPRVTFDLMAFGAFQEVGDGECILRMSHFELLHQQGECGGDGCELVRH